jgi:hypothetical protein
VMSRRVGACFNHWKRGKGAVRSMRGAGLSLGDRLKEEWRISAESRHIIVKGVSYITCGGGLLAVLVDKGVFIQMLSTFTRLRVCITGIT